MSYPINNTAAHWTFATENGTPPVTARAPHRVADAGTIINWVHDYAAEIGYARVRLDRGVHPSGAWYEVGQGCGEVGIRTGTRRWKTNQDLSRAMTTELRELLRSNIEEAEAKPSRSRLSILGPEVEARMGPERYLAALKSELEACWSALLDAERRANPLQQVRIRPEDGSPDWWTSCGHQVGQGCYRCCDRCNHNAHTCKGCGRSVSHTQTDCAACRTERESQS